MRGAADGRRGRRLSERADDEHTDGGSRREDAAARAGRSAAEPDGSSGPEPSDSGPPATDPDASACPAPRGRYQASYQPRSGTWLTRIGNDGQVSCSGEYDALFTQNAAVIGGAAR